MVQVEAERTMPHFSELDGMRGVLAILVMFLHLGLNTVISRSTHGWLPGGKWELSVDFFFLLSGYVLSRSFSKRRPSLLTYFWRRLGRLAPVFLISTTLMIAIGSEQISGSVLVANLMLIQSILNLPSINFPAWSISFEFFLPALGLVSSRCFQSRPIGKRELLVTAFLLTGGIIGCLLLAYGSDVPALRAVCGIGSGTMLYRVGWKVNLPSGAALGLFLCVLAIMLMSGKIPEFAIMFYPASAACILAALNSRTFLSTAPFQALGRWSYSIYLFHIPVLTFASSLFGEETLHGPIPKFLIIVFTLTLSAVIYQCIELPFIRSTQPVRTP
jgi:peptidoglycan/LPS O-acetylase OafA/YrhL